MDFAIPSILKREVNTCHTGTVNYKWPSRLHGMTWKRK